MEVGQLPRDLSAAVAELERNVQWSRIMQADLAATLTLTLTPDPKPNL